MSTPFSGARRVIDKLVVNLIDSAEVPIRRAQAEVSFAALGGPAGVAQPDGSMVFDESVGRALERVGEPGRLTDHEVAGFRHAAQVVTFTALSKRADGSDITAGDDADQFLNVGMPEAYWAVHGQRIAYNLSPELGSRLLQAEDPPGHPVAREAALAVAYQYAKPFNELPGNAVRALLRVPRDQVFESVADAALAHQLRDDYKSAQDALSVYRDGMATDLRTGFRQLAHSDAEPSEIHGRVAALYAQVDEKARTGRETWRGQLSTQTATAVQDHGKAAISTRTRTTGFGPLR